MHHAAGARQIITLHSERLAWDRDSRQSIDDFSKAIERASVAPNRLPLFSAHQMGTCRIGTDAPHSSRLAWLAAAVLGLAALRRRRA